MAWNAAKPADDGLLINAPGQIRANWDAIALQTDASLLITNAKCAAAMGLVDSKLAQITSSGKVSGTALTTLGSIPSGAGTIPLANIPDTLTGKDADTLDGQEGSYYLDVDNANAGTLATARGGLGADFSGKLQGNILYFSATGVISALGPGTDGFFLKTQGAGADPVWAANAVTQDLTFINSYSMSTVAASENIPISAGKLYKVFVKITALSGDADIYIRFNSDATGYGGLINGYSTEAGGTVMQLGAGGHSGIPMAISTTDSAQGSTVSFSAVFDLDTTAYTSTWRNAAHGSATYSGSAGIVGVNFWGNWTDNTAVTSFEIASNFNMTGTIYLWEYSLS